MTTSWDKTIMFWDPRSPGPPKTGLQLSERVFAADLHEATGIAVTADHNIHVFDIRLTGQGQQPGLTRAPFPITPLKLTPRAIKLFKGNEGTFAVASIEGRCSVRNIDQTKDDAKEPNPTKPHEQRTKSFAFRCHRDAQYIYPVNFIAVHPMQHAVFATGGSDGITTIWNQKERLKLQEIPKTAAPATAKKTPVNDGTWDASGEYFAFGCSYDWSKGQEYYKKDEPPVISIRRTDAAYLTKKK